MTASFHTTRDFEIQNDLYERIRERKMGAGVYLLKNMAKDFFPDLKDENTDFPPKQTECEFLAREQET